MEACREVLIPCIEYVQKLEQFSEALTLENQQLYEEVGRLNEELDSMNTRFGFMDIILFSTLGLAIGFAGGVAISTAF